MSRVLLLVPSATYRVGDFLSAAHAIGAEVVVASEHRLAGAAAADRDGSIVVSLSEPEAAARSVVSYAHKRPLDAVIAVDDQGVVAASLACERLGLAHNPPAAVEATRNKATLRRSLDQAELLQPAYRVVDRDTDPRTLARDVGFPCVVKPVGLSASRGVIRVDDPASAREAVERVRLLLHSAGAPADQPLLLERYVGGHELAVEGLLRDGQLEVLACFDKPDAPQGPYFEETLLVTPSRLSERALAAATDATANACAALGLSVGPIHAELRVEGESAYLLELAARSIGGLCSRSLRFGLGMRLEEVILRNALGLRLDNLAREPKASGVLMIPIPRAGILRAVDGQQEAAAVDGVVGVEVSAVLGRPIQPLPEGDRYLGFIFARAQSPREVELALREAHRRLDIRIDAAQP